jgi:hypothetical protein
MPRRREVPKREILPDPKFGSVDLSKFMNVIMESGKKAIAERIIAAVPPIAAQPAIQARLAEFASAPRSPALYGADFTRFVAAFRDHWVTMARAEGIVVA